MAARLSNSKSSKAGAGCLILFALPFAGFGIFALVMSAREWSRGNWKSGLGLILFGLVFCGVGFGLIAAALFGSKKVEQQNTREAAHPDEPWKWREDWARGEIQSSEKSSALFFWIFALFWNAISSAGLVAFLDEVHKKKAAWLILIFPLVGIGLLAGALVLTLRQRKFGVSTFKLASLPGVIGGALAGVVHCPKSLRGARRVHVRLVCLDRDTGGDNTTEKLQWEETKVLTGDVLAHEQGIPVLFNIPFACRPTEKMDTQHSIIWRLEVRAPMPGVDYVAAFELPVFKTSQSSAAANPLPDPAAAYIVQEDLAPPAGVTIRPAANGGQEFAFAARRNLGVLLYGTAFTLVWLGIVGVLVKFSTPIVFPIIMGGIGALLLLGTLQGWTGSSRVVADATGLSVTRSWLFGRRRRFVETSDLENITTKIGMSHGQNTYYDLVAMPKTGKKVKLASSIRGKKEAEWIVQEMRKAVGRT